MARRRRPDDGPLEHRVDEVAVRWRAARRTFIMAGGVGASGDWSSPDYPWWERWSDRSAQLRNADDPAALVKHYERAVDRLAAREIYEREIERARRHLALNTAAVRARRRGGAS